MPPIEKKTISLYNKTRKLFKRKYICYAPFNSLRFNNNGMVQPCCHSVNYNLGNFNTESIMDIWHGKKLADLRHSIINAELNLGCIDCKNQIINKNYYAVEARKFDLLPLHSKYPVFFDIKTSRKCNLSCIMCKPENSNQILTQCGDVKDIFNYDKFIKELDIFIPHLKHLHFCGGEPFIEEHYFEIWHKIITVNPEIRIDITSNITVLNDKIINLLEKGNFYIYPSIDSFEKNTYEKIRVNASFEKVMQNFNYFHDYHKKRKKSFHINACPITENWHEIPAMVDFCNKNEIYLKLHNVVYPSNLSLFKLPSDEMNKIFNSYVLASYNMKKGQSQIVKNNMNNFEALINRISLQIQKESKTHRIFSKEEIPEKIKEYILNEMSLYTLKEKEVLIENMYEKHVQFFQIIENEYIEYYEDVLKFISVTDFSEIIFALNSKDLNIIIKDIIFEIKNNKNY